MHILPLQRIPLETASLRRARLVKTVRLECMVELFNEQGVGTGRVKPTELKDVFDFSGDRARDPEIIIKLAGLRSYDVFSLRVSLRQLDVALDGLEGFQPSERMAAELGEYMNDFTRPLVAFVCGEVSPEAVDLIDMQRVIADPNSTTAIKNLRRLASLLEIQMVQIPDFLQDYADVFMSLSFYRQCLEKITPKFADLVNTLNTIRASHDPINEHRLIKDCDAIEAKFTTLVASATDTLDKFRDRTENMWENPTGERYREMERLVLDHQEQIGEIICALTVKTDAWAREFPEKNEQSRLADKTAFITSDIKFGLDKLKPLTF